MRVMLDTNILFSLIFFLSAVFRDFARRVGFGNRIVLYDSASGGKEISEPTEDFGTVLL